MTQKERIKIDTDAGDIFPAMIDYDFVNNRPRGGSARVDFFSQGRLDGILDNVKLNNHVFIKKSNLFFENGVFLVDFSSIDSNIKDLTEMVAKLDIDKLYLENSRRYNVDKFTESLENIDITLLDFY